MVSIVDPDHFSQNQALNDKDINGVNVRAMFFLSRNNVTRKTLSKEALDEELCSL